MYELESYQQHQDASIETLINAIVRTHEYPPAVINSLMSCSDAYENLDAFKDLLMVVNDPAQPLAMVDRVEEMKVYLTEQINHLDKMINNLSDIEEKAYSLNLEVDEFEDILLSINQTIETLDFDSVDVEEIKNTLEVYKTNPPTASDLYVYSQDMDNYWYDIQKTILTNEKILEIIQERNQSQELTM